MQIFIENITKLITNYTLIIVSLFILLKWNIHWLIKVKVGTEVGDWKPIYPGSMAEAKAELVCRKLPVGKPDTPPE